MTKLLRSPRSLVGLAIVLALAVATGGAPFRLVADIVAPGSRLYLLTEAPTAERPADHPADLRAGTPRAVPAAVSASTVALSVAPASKPEFGYVLRGKLTTKDGQPINDAVVRFYEPVELFGSREMLIATTTSDGQGIATISYLPAQPGTHPIVIRSLAKGSVPGAEGRFSFEATVAAPSYEVDRPPLAEFTAKVPYVVGVLVLGVWFAIGFALLGTARGIAMHAGRATRKEDLAELALTRPSL